jgi:flagellar basal-body rod modification protein FlgD
MGINATVPSASNVLTSSEYAESQSKAAASEEDLGRDAFLTLFTAQLQNQDPLSPMKNEAFVSQLAQFSSLESMQSVDTSMQSMTEGMKSDRFLLGANLLGTTISVPGEQTQLVEGGQISGTSNLEESHAALLFSVSDANGKPVYEERFENVPAGSLNVKWNGANAAGERQPAGSYSLSLTGLKDGEAIEIPVNTPQIIQSVRWNDARNEVQVEIANGQTFSLADLEKFNI